MIDLKNLNKIYNRGKQTEVQALKEVNLHVAAGDFISVTGPSGSGKSTLLHILAGLDMPTSGVYFFEDIDMTKASERAKCRLRNQQIGIVLQDFGLLGDNTALENVCLPLTIQGVCRKTALHRARSALEQAGVADLAGKTVNQLSGGQRQRVAIARALVQNTRLLLADEPTGALDSENTHALMNLLEELNRSGITIIIVTHNIAVAERTSISYNITDGILCQSR